MSLAEILSALTEIWERVDASDSPAVTEFECCREVQFLYAGLDKILMSPAVAGAGAQGGGDHEGI